MTDAKLSRLVERVLKENIECYNMFPLAIDVTIPRKCCEIVENEARREERERINNWIKKEELYKPKKLNSTDYGYYNAINKLKILLFESKLKELSKE